MNKGMLKPSLVIAVLVCVFTFLFVQTQTIDATEQSRVTIRIQGLAYQDALLNESILEAQAGRFSNYDSLTKYKKNIIDHLDWLESMDSGLYGALGSDLDKAINHTAKHFNDKINLTERFKSHNSILKNSLHYLPTAIKRKQNSPVDALYQSDLNHLLTEVLLFNSRPNDQNEVNATELIEELRQTNRPNLSQLALHAETILQERLKLKIYVNELFSIPTRQSVDTIYQLYSRYSAAKLAQASAYRTAMYAMALVLIMYVLHLFLALRKTMRSLQDSLSELAFQKHALDEHSIVAVMDSEQTITYVNEEFNHISQFSKENIVGKGLISFGSECNPVSFFTEMRETLFDGKSWKRETLCLKKDGSRYWVDATIVPFLDEVRNPLRYVALLTDITARKKAEAEQEIVYSELRLAASVFSDSAMGIMITDSKGLILRANDAFSEITGFSLSEAVGQSVEILKSDFHDSHFFCQMWDSLAKSGQWEGEIWNRRKDGDLYPILSSITAIHNSSGEISHYINSFSDISKKKIAEDHILHLAHYDALTELPNRAFFLERVEEAIAESSDSQSKIAVLFLDLDNFKMVNDTMGHARGDTLLKEVAQKLRSCVRKTDIVARLGGDEFIIALLDIQSPSQVDAVAKKILTATRESVTAGDTEIVVSSSIGISILPDDATDVEILIENADTAMYQAKTDGKSTHQFFHDLAILRKAS